MFSNLAQADHRFAAVGIILAATTAALAAWSALVLSGVDIQVEISGELSSVGAVEVIVASMVGGLGAWLVHTLMHRQGLARRWWPSVGSIALAISMLGPSTSADGGSAMALMTLHFVVGIVLIYGFAQLSPNHPRR